MLSAKFRGYLDYIVIPVARILARTGVSPNTLTVLGFIFSIFTALAFMYGELGYAFWLLLITSILDVFDGAVAKVSKKVTEFGGFLDSTLDRYSDAIILLGIAIYLGAYYDLIFVVLVGSLLVSYTRAKAELFIQKCDVGIAERAERLIILMLATLLSYSYLFYPPDIFFIALVILAVITHFTVLQRIYYTYRQLSS